MLPFDTSYLDRTANKWPRSGVPAALKGVVWHETASKSSNPEGTLKYNLSSAVGSSYNYLIARDGTIFHYVDERAWIAYGAGKHDDTHSATLVLDGQSYSGLDLNAHVINVEVDGPNDGTPITAAQRDSIVAVARFFQQTYGIPLDKAHHYGHKEFTSPDYKTDPRGYSVLVLLSLANAQPPPPAPQPLADRQVIGVAPSITLSQWYKVLRNHGGQDVLSPDEMQRVYAFCSWLDIDPAFVLAIWLHEGGNPLGSSALQRQTHNPFNMRAAADEWRQTVTYKGGKWAKNQTFQTGLYRAVLHLKDEYGAQGLLTVDQILPTFAPESDDNNLAAYRQSVLEDIQRMGQA